MTLIKRTYQIKSVQFQNVVIAVSYTHLDVYKRQVLDGLNEENKNYIAKLLEANGIANANEIVNYRLAQSKDVYKRQGKR